MLWPLNFVLQIFFTKLVGLLIIMNMWVQEMETFTQTQMISIIKTNPRSAQLTHA